MGGIFISYRRKDTAYIAGRLHDRLAAHFGPGQIFRDIETIKPGVDFGELIDEQVGSCDVFLAIIGDNWLVNRNPEGKRPIGVQRDWVQREIEVALARPDVLVVPVLVENAVMPSEQELPYSIRALARRNAMELSDRRWDYEVGKLIEALEEVVIPQRAAVGRQLTEGGPAHQGSAPDAPQWAPRQFAPGDPGPGPGGGRSWQPPPRPAPPPPHRPMIPTWLKVVVPIVVLAVMVVMPSVVLVRNLIARAKDETEPVRVVQGPFTGTSGAVTLTVEKVEVGKRYVRLHLAVDNRTKSALGLSTGFFSAVDDTGHSYEVDRFSDEWPGRVPPDGRVADTIKLDESLRPEATWMKVGWSTVFETLEVKSIFVEKVSLT